MLRNIVMVLFLLAITSGANVSAWPGASKKPAREVFGLRMGMSEESVHKRLRKIAVQQKEEKEQKEGEQEVWALKRDSRFSYLLTRFDRNHRLFFVMVVAHPNRVRYDELATISDAEMASDGRNYSYRWKVPGSGREKGYLLTARGSSPEYLTSYSVVSY
jgi:hypothetical protein